MAVKPAQSQLRYVKAYTWDTALKIASTPYANGLVSDIRFSAHSIHAAIPLSPTYSCGSGFVNFIASRNSLAKA